VYEAGLVESPASSPSPESGDAFKAIRPCQRDQRSSCRRIRPVPSAAHAETSGAATQDEFGLTQREQEVLSGLLAGQTNREIAESLFISTKTSSVHVSNILRKLGVKSREEAARVAHRQMYGN